MTDGDTAPTFTIDSERLAQVFYEMHTLCENDLDLSIRQKNLISLGYLLYSSPDAIQLITTLKWVHTELIVEIHQLMLRVCKQALLCVAERGCHVSAQTLTDYDDCMRLIAHKTRLLRLNSLTMISKLKPVY